MPRYIYTIVISFPSCVKSVLNRSFIHINSFIPCTFYLLENKIPARKKISPRFQKFLLITLLAAITSGCTDIIHNMTSEPVQPEPTSTPIGTGINDWNIETMVGVNIKKADSRLEKAHINVYAYNAVVLLTGETDTEQLRNLAGTTARSFHGVRQVYNEIQVISPSTLTSRSHDSWLATKVRTKLIAEKNFDSSPVQVVCENDIIYLLGLVSRSQGSKAATIASTSTGVERVVKVFEYID